MNKEYLNKIQLVAVICCIYGILYNFQNFAQVSGTQQQQTKWLKVSSLHQWFSSGGAEIEYGRRGRAGFLNVDQLDGLNWPGLYTINKGVNVGKSLWIGTTNFPDPVSGITYAQKVVCAGRLNIFLGTEIFSDDLSLIGRFPHPVVTVDGIPSTNLDADDEVDEIDETLVCDRMIVNHFHTSIGISVTRKVMAFTQQYHDNYYITEYVFKNTGIINATGQPVLNRTLTDVVFHFQYRYGFAGESYLPANGWAPQGSPWGLNTINNAIGQDANHPGDFRAVWSYYGPHANGQGREEDIGLPRYTDGSILAGTNYAGVVVLHADRSPQDPSDDPSQPSTTQFMPSDRGAQGVDQFDPVLMARKYNEFMTAGDPPTTHAEQVGTAFANTWGGDAGGYAAAQGFGPYDLAIGDSIRIVVAEGVAGIMSDRDFVKEIARNWFNNSGPFTLPDNSTTTDRNTYKNTWVLSGEDSIFQTFKRALDNYNNNFNIPQPPPPPQHFNVASGGNRINLTWTSEAESWGNFNGYEIYRAQDRPDTTYDLVFSCYKNKTGFPNTPVGIVNTFDDRTPRRGFNYYYYIQSVDDGSTNLGNPDLNIPAGAPLASSKYYTMTNLQAILTRPPGNSLSEIRVVPNPFNIRAVSIQFGSGSPDRLAFFGLPPVCVIKIYTENGDLIETIEHTDGSGDELWHSLTSSRQLVVSGVYIAYFEVTKDIYGENNELLFRAGENTFRKFIIIR